ncbi:MAG: transketolase [Candidatus Ozemobacteraceae bacterium]
MSNALRIKIVDMITKAREGHIPSSFSIVDIIDTIYDNFLKFDPSIPNWDNRDFFILSKGHGAAALFVVLEKHGFISQKDLDNYGNFDSILGGHPDRSKIPGVEASTGSLGHGLPFSLGIALGMKISGKPNKVITLVGDGECHEGTIWETALVAQNLKLSNLCCIVDLNGSAAQILPHPNIAKQWEAFGWETREIDGHNKSEIENALQAFSHNKSSRPFAIIAHTVKGKGVRFLEVHGPWHHRIPNAEEYSKIIGELQEAL